MLLVWMLPSFLPSTQSTTKTQATRSTPSAPACSDAFGSTTRFPTTSKSSLNRQMGRTKPRLRNAPSMQFKANVMLLGKMNDPNIGEYHI
uniref:Secreted protein n=1 Tax=Picea glauca TaxID=3330 RepID=A0A101M4Q1_PICGL|nr:hypothetical protein ABT39_MTgene811 [Picea glauca]